MQIFLFLHFTDIPATVLRLLTNNVYTLLILGIGLKALRTAGLTAFNPKYMEVHFGLTASESNIFGGQFIHLKSEYIYIRTVYYSFLMYTLTSYIYISKTDFKISAISKSPISMGYTFRRLNWYRSFLFSGFNGNNVPKANIKICSNRRHSFPWAFQICYTHPN